VVGLGRLLGALVQAPIAELGTGAQELDDAVMLWNAHSRLNVSYPTGRVNLLLIGVYWAFERIGLFYITSCNAILYMHFPNQLPCSV
jgi:hypothetical protein